MVRTIQKIGTSRGVILTRDMLDHLGVQDAIEINIEEGRIILTAPSPDAIPTRRRATVHEAVQKGINQYRPALEKLAE